MSRLLRIIRLAIGASPLLLCKVGRHDWRNPLGITAWQEEEMDEPLRTFAEHLVDDRCTRCLRWRD